MIKKILLTSCVALAFIGCAADKQPSVQKETLAKPAANAVVDTQVFTDKAGKIYKLTTTDGYMTGVLTLPDNTKIPVKEAPAASGTRLASPDGKTDIHFKGTEGAFGSPKTGDVPIWVVTK